MTKSETWFTEAKKKNLETANAALADILKAHDVHFRVIRQELFEEGTTQVEFVIMLMNN